jgi:hypothetical protein
MQPAIAAPLVVGQVPEPPPARRASTPVASHGVFSGGIGAEVPGAAPPPRPSTAAAAASSSAGARPPPLRSPLSLAFASRPAARWARDYHQDAESSTSELSVQVLNAARVVPSAPSPVAVISAQLRRMSRTEEVQSAPASPLPGSEASAAGNEALLGPLRRTFSIGRVHDTPLPAAHSFASSTTTATVTAQHGAGHEHARAQSHSDVTPSAVPRATFSAAAMSGGGSGGGGGGGRAGASSAGVPARAASMVALGGGGGGVGSGGGGASAVTSSGASSGGASGAPSRAASFSVSGVRSRSSMSALGRSPSMVLGALRRAPSQPSMLLRKLSRSSRGFALQRAADLAADEFPMAAAQRPQLSTGRVLDSICPQPGKFDTRNHDLHDSLGAMQAEVARNIHTSHTLSRNKQHLWSEALDRAIRTMQLGHKRIQDCLCLMAHPSATEASVAYHNAVARRFNVRNRLGKLKPLMSPTGEYHPKFPQTVSQLRQLREHELVSLLVHLHVPWDARTTEGEKRRLLARFVGLGVSSRSS